MKHLRMYLGTSQTDLRISVHLILNCMWPILGLTIINCNLYRFQFNTWTGLLIKKKEKPGQFLKLKSQKPIFKLKHQEKNNHTPTHNHKNNFLLISYSCIPRSSFISPSQMPLPLLPNLFCPEGELSQNPLYSQHDKRKAEETYKDFN